MEKHSPLRTNLRKSLLFSAHRLFLESSIGSVYERMLAEDRARAPETRTRQLLFALLAHAQACVPYYAGLISQTNPRFNSDPETFLAQFPILTKEIIRQNGDRLKSADLKRRKWGYNSSGGSTGEPVRLIQDRQYLDHQMAIQWLSFTWAGRDFGEPAFFLWGSETDILQGTIGLRKKILNQLTNDRFLNAFLMTPEKMRTYLDLLNRFPPKLIVAYAQSIYELAQFAEREKIQVVPQAAIMTSAGTLFPFMRQKIETIFQCKVYNRYGSREVGDIACECEAHTGLHVFPWGNYVEIVDEQGRPVPNGTEGNILVTNLSNYAMPLIRYFIGDRGTLAPADRCTCGRHGQILEKISGRNVDVFKKADGTLVDGEYFTHLLYFKDWVRKFQIVQKDYSHIEFRIIKGDGKFAPEELDEIKERTRIVMGEDCLASIEFLEDIPPSRSGKYRYTICEVN